MARAQAITPPPAVIPGQCWSVYHPGGKGLDQGERLFVVATMNAERVTLLATYELLPIDWPAETFAAYGRKELMDVPPRRLAKRIRAGLKERANADAEIAELALSALGWTHDEPKPENGAHMLDISIGQRTYTKPAAARRAAYRALGNPHAVEGVDYDIQRKENGAVAMVLNTGSKGKTDKIAAGPSGIARQFGARDDRKARRVEEIKEFAGAPVDALAAATGAAKKPAKAPKKPAAKKPAKKTPKPKATKKPKAGKKAGKGDAGKKMATIREMLTRKGGTTRRELLDALGWPSISVQVRAEQLGLTLKTAKAKGEPTRYSA